MKIALVYDRINKIGGAERIISALHELYPQAPIYTLVYDSQKAVWARNLHIKTSFMQYLPFAKTYHEFYPILPIFAFESFQFSEYDLVISVTATEAKGIITSPNTLHVCYLLTPTRFLWSHYFDYFTYPLIKKLSLPFISTVRLWDTYSAQRPDRIVTISRTVQKRIEKYYRRQSRIINPPVEIFNNIEKKRVSRNITNNYFLIVSRLVKYKHIELAIRACEALKLPLKIIGSGFEKNFLLKIAKGNTEFLNNISEEELSHYYESCRALICPQEEDFGITAVEALAHGRPVIAFNGGGITEIVEQGITGELFYPQDTPALIETLELFMQRTYSEVLCRKTAERFSKIIFKRKFSAYIDEVYIDHLYKRKISL